MPALRLLSWNVHGTPGAPRRRARFDAIAQRICEEEPDLVLLQEVWLPADATRLENRLAQWFTRVGPPDRPIWLRPSGLLTFVRRGPDLRLISSSLERFRDSAPRWKLWEGDAFGRKGIQQLRLRFFGGEIAVLHTHLQASYTDGGHRAVRVSQLRQLNAHAATIDDAIPLLAAGDLNTRPEEAELYPLISDRWLDLTESLRLQTNCSTHFEEGPGMAGWIDYILARRGSSVISARVRLIHNEASDDPYSDHEGLIAEIEV